MNKHEPWVFLTVFFALLAAVALFTAFSWKQTARSTDARWSDFQYCMDTVEERALCSELFNPPEPANEFKTLTERERLILEGE